MARPAAVLALCSWLGPLLVTGCADSCDSDPGDAPPTRAVASGQPGAAEPDPAVSEGAPGDQAPGRNPPPGRTRLVLLGTGTPNTDPERSGPAVAVVVDDVPYLVDAGPGVVRRAAAAWQRGEPALEVSELERVFLTHLHSDHTVGLPDLLLTPWVLGRAEPLHVHGPPGTEEMVEHVQAAWAEDVRVRLDGLEPANEDGHRAVAHVMEPGDRWSDERVTVTAHPVEHGSWEHAYAYRFETPDRVVVVSGDTAPSEAVVRACDGCDVLLHEVYSQVAFDRQPAGWGRYHRAFHTSSTELAELATEARPGLLVLYHHLLWGQSPEGLLEEVRARYEGEVVFGRDLDVY